MNRKPSLLVIFLSVFIDLIGFGIVLPLLPGYAEDNFRPDFSAKGLVIGGIIASFSAMQFFFAPVWGRLSDRIGRRPVMLISNLGRRRFLRALRHRLRHERHDRLGLDPLSRGFLPAFAARTCPSPPPTSPTFRRRKNVPPAWA